MPQGKIKVKSQLPSNVKGKKIRKLDKAKPKKIVQRKCYILAQNEMSFYYIAQCFRQPHRSQKNSNDGRE